MGKGFSGFISLKFADNTGLNCCMPLQIHLCYLILLAIKIKAPKICLESIGIVKVLGIASTDRFVNYMTRLHAEIKSSYS